MEARRNDFQAHLSPSKISSEKGALGGWSNGMDEEDTIKPCGCDIQEIWKEEEME